MPRLHYTSINLPVVTMQGFNGDHPSEWLAEVPGFPQSRAHDANERVAAERAADLVEQALAYRRTGSVFDAQPVDTWEATP